MASPIYCQTYPKLLSARQLLAERAIGRRLAEIILNFLFGKPNHVCGQVSKVVHQIPVEDSATVMIDYETGVRCVVDVRWNSCIDRDDFRLIGTEGDMVLTPPQQPPPPTLGRGRTAATHRNLDYPWVTNFVDAVQGIAPVAAPIDRTIVTDWVTEQALNANGVR